MYLIINFIWTCQHFFTFVFTCYKFIHLQYCTCLCIFPCTVIQFFILHVQVASMSVKSYTICRWYFIQCFINSICYVFFEYGPVIWSLSNFFYLVEAKVYRVKIRVVCRCINFVNTLLVKSQSWYSCSIAVMGRTIVYNKCVSCYCILCFYDLYYTIKTSR